MNKIVKNKSNFIICVYKITSPSGKVYIGSTVNWRERLSAYNRLDCEKQTKLYSSLKKYGPEKHIFEVVEYCSIDCLRQKEHYYGQLFNVLSKHGLNHKLPKFGEGFVSVSEEFRLANGIRKKGNTYTKGRKYGPNVRAKISASKKGISNGPHTKETKEKMSASAMGGKNHNAIILLNIETGIYYECFKDAAFAYNMKYNTFRSRLYHKRNMPFIVTPQ
jgi:group I intron endonuclease